MHHCDNVLKTEHACIYLGPENTLCHLLTIATVLALLFTQAIVIHTIVFISRLIYVSESKGLLIVQTSVTSAHNIGPQLAIPDH